MGELRNPNLGAKWESTSFSDKKTGKSSIPSARVKHTKTVGGSKFNLLVWDSPEGETYWEEESAFNFENSEENEAYSCNTRKVRIF